MITTELTHTRPSRSPAEPDSRQRALAGRGATDRVAAAFWRALLFRALGAIREGELVVREGGRVRRFGDRTSRVPLRAEIRVLDPRFYAEVALHGSVGAGRAWFEGLWTSDDLVTVVRILARNDEALRRWQGGPARLVAPFRRRFHALRRNTREGSRRNIEAHYDLSNEFFALFLDETLTYSAGIFPSAEATLREASVEKLDRICRVLDLRPTDHVLEIGTGWGSFALHAAGRYGCRVTTTTISRQQHDLAAERIRAAGLEDRITLLCQDYRDLRGTYDKLVSIEMIEAVGHDFLDTYFRTCSERLVPGGKMCLQAITIRDELYDRARRSVDFIKRFIFPGSDIPSLQAITDSVARATDFRITGYHELTLGYARTLRAWRRNLLDRTAEARSLGFDDRFLAMWDFYFAYCEGGFLEGRIQDFQIVLEKPGPALAPEAARLGDAGESLSAAVPVARTGHARNQEAQRA